MCCFPSDSSDKESLWYIFSNNIFTKAEVDIQLLKLRRWPSFLLFITCAFACAWFTVVTDHLPLEGVFKFFKVSKSNFYCKEYNNCLTQNFCQVNKTSLQTLSAENLLNRLDSTSTYYSLHSLEKFIFFCNLHTIFLHIVSTLE